MAQRSPSIKSASFSKTQLTFDNRRQSTKKAQIERQGSTSPSDVYQPAPVTGMGASPTQKTGEQSYLVQTQTSDWKSKLSPRAKGRIQIALPTDGTTEFNLEDVSAKGQQIPAGDLTIKKEFAQTGNFPARLKTFGLNSGNEKNRKTVYGGSKVNEQPVHHSKTGITTGRLNSSDYGDFNKSNQIRDDITAREQDISHASLTNEQNNFVDRSAFKMLSDEAEMPATFPIKRRSTVKQNLLKKRNASNIRRTTNKGQATLAPLQLAGGATGRSQVNGHKSAAPQRPKKGSDFVNIYTSSLPLSIKLQSQQQQQTFQSSRQMTIREEQSGIKKQVSARQSQMSLQELSLRDGDTFSQDMSIMPRNFAPGEGVPVMKIGLNNPHTKSIVMSTTEFSADELEPAPQQVKQQTKKRKKNRRNTKMATARPSHLGSNDIQTSIINEEDDQEDVYNSRNLLGKQGASGYLKLNEQSVNVELETSRDASAYRNQGSRDQIVVNDQVDTLEEKDQQQSPSGAFVGKKSSPPITKASQLGKFMQASPFKDETSVGRNFMQKDSQSMALKNNNQKLSSMPHHGSVDQKRSFFSGNRIKEIASKQTVSVSQIRQSRQKIELDVVRLHNRIQLLEAEEERATKIIEDTKNKVKQIMKSRAANEQFQKDLEKAREKEFKRKQAVVRKRMNAKLPSMTPTNKPLSHGPSSPMSPSMAMPTKITSDGLSLAMPANESQKNAKQPASSSQVDLAKAQELPQQFSIRTSGLADTSILSNQTGVTLRSRQELGLIKEQQAAAIKKETEKLLKAKKKQEAKELKQMQERRMLIKAQQEKAKEKSDQVAAQKWAAVRQQKDDIIKQEIIRIGEKDSEARRLEKYEQKILKRLRQTHQKQQEAIQEIQGMFTGQSTIRNPQNSSKMMFSGDWMTEPSMQIPPHHNMSMSTTHNRVNNNSFLEAGEGLQGSTAGHNLTADHLHNSSIHEEPAEQLARDSIYEAEGEESFKKSSDFIPGQLNQQSIDEQPTPQRDRAAISSQEGLIDPEAVGLRHQTTLEQHMKGQISGQTNLASSSKAIMVNSSGTLKTENASLKHLIQSVQNESGNLDHTGKTNKTAKVGMEAKVESPIREHVSEADQR